MLDPSSAFATWTIRSSLRRTLVTRKQAEQRSTWRLRRRMARPLGATTRRPICSSTFCIAKSAVTQLMLESDGAGPASNAIAVLVSEGAWLTSSTSAGVS